MSIPTKMRYFLSYSFCFFFLCSGICRGFAATKDLTNISAPAKTLCKSATVCHFLSVIDGKDDCYSFRYGPSTQSSAVLLVYFHGLSGDFNELFKSDLADAINKTFPSLTLLSCNYGRIPSWGNAIARIDITNNIRQFMKKNVVKHIVLVGSSMGASTALAYAATAPDYIKQKIIGIVSVSPCAELADLYQQSSAPEVKTSLEAALGGSATNKAAFYHQNSLDSCLAFLPQPLKIAVITAKEDTLIPIAVQMDVVRDLNNRDIELKSFELEGKSEPPPLESIIQGLHFVLQ